MTAIGQSISISNRTEPTLARPAGKTTPGLASPAADEVRFGQHGQREGLVGRRRHDGRIEWIPASQAMRDQQRLSRWDSGKRSGGGGGGDDEDPLVKAIKDLLRKIGIHL